MDQETGRDCIGRGESQGFLFLETLDPAEDDLQSPRGYIDPGMPFSSMHIVDSDSDERAGSRFAYNVRWGHFGSLTDASLSMESCSRMTRRKIT